LLEDLISNNGVHTEGQNAASAHPENTTQEQVHGVSALDALRWKSRAQETRIEELERKLAAAEKNNNPSLFMNVKTVEPEVKEEMMFRGKGFKTQFHGSTSVMSTISQVWQAFQVWQIHAHYK
jgi:hypothetical protein